MHAQIKISQHEHTGRLRPHEHTSYFLLALLVTAVGVMLMAFSALAFAADPPPQSSSIGLTGTLPAKPPKVAAVITVPKGQQHFTTSPITVSGTCPAATLVEIYKNNIFAGSTPCTDAGTFSLQIDLLYGANSLTAQVYDVLNQAGPLSDPVNVFYDATQAQAASLSFLNFSGAQLVLNTTAIYRGSFPRQTLNVPINIIGGTQPFAVNVQWGDSSNKIIPRGDNSTFNASHSYQKAGTYKITVQATDSQQQVAFLTVAAVINGQPSAIAITNVSNVSKPLLNKLLVLWPLYAIIVTLVVSFWMGERREKRILAEAIARQQLTLGAGSNPMPHPTS